MSALHGLVPLNLPLHPYNVTLGDERAITAAAMVEQAVSHGLFDAHVIFLGGQRYAALLRPSVPHLVTPLAGGMGKHRHICKQIGLDVELRANLWQEACFHYDEYFPG